MKKKKLYYCPRCKAVLSDVYLEGEDEDGIYRHSAAYSELAYIGLGEMNLYCNKHKTTQVLSIDFETTAYEFLVEVSDLNSGYEFKLDNLDAYVEVSLNNLIDLLIAQNSAVTDGKIAGYISPE